MSVVRLGDPMHEPTMAEVWRIGPRLDGSEVYIIYNSGNHLECVGCSLRDGLDSFFCDEDKPSEMVAHLKEHIDAGHRVPSWVIRNLSESQEKSK